MMTVHQVSRLTGVSIRTLQYYDKIGLLPPADVTEAGYRLYDRSSLEKLQQILLFRELEFSLKEIREIVSSPGFDRNKALRQQIQLLTLKKEYIENLIALAQERLTREEPDMSFEAFDRQKLEAYTKQAKVAWGGTSAWKEYEAKAQDRTENETRDLAGQMMEFFRQFGMMRDRDPADTEVQALVEKLQAFITEHYYTCTKEILSALGQGYAAGGEFTANIDRAGGAGTAVFAAEAIAIYCEK